MNNGLFHGCLRTACVVHALSMLTTAPLHGAVVFTDIPDISSYGRDVVTFGIDFNFDSVVDVELRNLGHEFAAFPSASNRVAGVTAIPPDQNNFAAALIGGDVIGASLDFYTWNTGYCGLINCKDRGCLGFFSGGAAYLGVEFSLDDTLHYGWILIDNELGAGGGVIKSFAYESEAGVPIVAGAIPEPSTSVLIGGGTALMLKRNSQTRKQNKALQRTTRGLFVSTLNLIRKCLGFGSAQIRP